MSEWQPIETAPKDGRLILVWDEDCDHHEVVAWSVGHHCWLIGYGVNPEPGQTINVVGDTCYLPSHWMPLPPPPEPKER